MYVLIQFTRTQMLQQSDVWACFFHSDNLYGPRFVFIMECEFDSTDIEGTACIELRHVSGFLTHRSVKWCLTPLNHQFRSCCFHSSAAVPATIYSCTSVINWNILVINKTYKWNQKLHLFLNTQCCCQDYVIRICFNPVFQISCSACNKFTAFVLQWDIFWLCYKDNGLWET
jgi:hypothetical protein